LIIDVSDAEPHKAGGNLGGRANGSSARLWQCGPKKELFGTEAFFVDPDGYHWAVLAT